MYGDIRREKSIYIALLFNIILKSDYTYFVRWLSTPQNRSQCLPQLLMLYDLVATKRACKLLQNHAITIMLIFNFVHLTVDASILISYRHLEYVLLFNPVVCLIQQFVDDGITSISFSSLSTDLLYLNDFFLSL
jgi:hypothetical protein